MSKFATCLGTNHEVLHSSLTTDRGCKSSRVENSTKGPKPSRRHETPKGWAVGVPYSAAIARTRLRNVAIPQRLRAAPLRPRSHVPTHCSFSHAFFACHLRVVRSPVAFLVATRPWRPVRCAARLVFLWSAVPREGRHLVSSGGLLPAGTGLDTSLEQRVGRLSHDPHNRKTLVAAGVPQEVRPVVPAHPRQSTPRPPGQLLCDYLQPLPIVEVDQAGRGDSHSRPVRCVVGTVG